MLSKEEIEDIKERNEGSTIADLCDMALQWASVQEGLKDAREAFEDFVTPNGYSIETDPDGEYACPEVRLQKYAFMAGARHNAAFALKQKGEVVWEGEIPVVRGTWPNGATLDPGSCEGIKASIVPFIGQRIHVTFSLPQQEQDHQGVSTNQEESKS